MLRNLAYCFLAEAESFWDSNFAAALIGASSALAVVFITEVFSRQRSEMGSLQAQIDDLTMSVNEIEFYIPIITKAQTLIAEAEIEINNNRDKFTLPSFRLDATLLQSLRRSLSTHSANPGIVKLLTKCAFELQHVQNKLDHINQRVHLVRQTTDILHIDAVIRRAVSGDVQGAAKLAEITAELFTNSVPELKRQIADCEHRLESIRSFKILPGERA